jgi:hypothetical protein
MPRMLQAASEAVFVGGSKSHVKGDWPTESSKTWRLCEQDGLRLISEITKPMTLSFSTPPLMTAYSL